MSRQHLKWLLLWLAGIAILLIAGLGLTTIRRGFNARDKPTWIEAVAGSSARSLAVPEGVKQQMRKPIPNTAESLRKHKRIWRQRRC